MLKHWGVTFGLVLAVSLPGQARAQDICAELISPVYHPPTSEDIVECLDGWRVCVAMPHCCLPTCRLHPECTLAKTATKPGYWDNTACGFDLLQAVIAGNELADSLLIGQLSELIFMYVDAHHAFAEPIPDHVQRLILELTESEYAEGLPSFNSYHVQNARILMRSALNPDVFPETAAGFTLDDDMIVLDDDLYRAIRGAAAYEVQDLVRGSVAKGFESALMTLTHELVHARQISEIGRDAFVKTYFLDCAINGYHGAAWEKEAYALDEGLLDRLLHHRRPTGFEHASYAGRFVRMGAPSVEGAAPWNVVSSMTVPPGWTVKLKTVDLAATLALTSDTPSFGPEFNDRIGSASFTQPPMLYFPGDGQDEVQILPEGRYDVHQLWANDAVKSLYVPSGWRVRLYEHAAFGGAQRYYDASILDLGDFAGRASSVIVERRCTKPIWLTDGTWATPSAEASGCKVLQVPAGQTPQIVDSNYFGVRGQASCPFGTFDGTRCGLAVPSTARVDLYYGRYRLTMAPDRCSQGWPTDAGCFLRSAPTGTTGFIATDFVGQQRFYYTYPVDPNPLALEDDRISYRQVSLAPGFPELPSYCSNPINVPGWGLACVVMPAPTGAFVDASGAFMMAKNQCSQGSFDERTRRCVLGQSVGYILLEGGTAFAPPTWKCAVGTDAGEGFCVMGSTPDRAFVQNGYFYYRD